MRILVVFIACLLCACQTVTQQPPAPGISAARESGSGVALIGLGNTTLSGACELGFGPAGSEKAIKTVEMGWALDNGQVTYRAFDLTPGAWDFFSLTCGSITFDAPIGSPGYSQAGTRYNALARFFISPREVLYLGDLTMVPEPPFARFSSEIRTDVARKELSRHQPDLGKAMITRPLFRDPG